MPDSKNIRTPRPHVSGHFLIRNFYLPDSASVHTYQVDLVYESATFWIHSLEWKFLYTVWFRNHVNVNSGYFLSGDVTRWSPRSFPWILYSRWQPRSQVLSLTRLYNACSVANIPIRVLGTRVNPDTCGWANSIWTWIRVYVEIFESGKKKLRIQKYPNTCGRGLNQPI